TFCFLAIMTISCFSCTKNKVTVSTAPCYTCKIIDMYGTATYKDVCTNRIDTVQFRDQNNNNLQSVCNRK
ncbi:MAG TPA: hypothetical protein VNR87_12325, partial [Flavisolibacter sp.]|nr:hypothetical protein [Flavisolibacter sp.]